MKKIFTKLVCVGMACFCMVSVMGQENKPVEKIIERKDIPQDDVTLRAYSEYFWPDSVVRFNSAGQPTSKTYYNKENRTESGTWLDSGSWKISEPRETDGIHWWIGKVDIINYDGEPMFIHPQLDGETNFVWNTKFSYEHVIKVYDAKGNLIRVEFRMPDFPDFFIEHRILYNDRNDPVLIELYIQKDLWGKIQYEYNKNGYMTLHERYQYVNNKWIITNDNYKQTAEYDELGRPVADYFFVGSATLNQWVLSRYSIYYYSDTTTMNEQIKQYSSTAYLIDKTLYVYSEEAERIAIYSITGSNLYETTIQAGLNTINAANFPQGILFIKGSSGWVKKVIAK